MSVWEWLNEPVLPRWFAGLLALWLALGKPELPVGRIAARFRKRRTKPCIRCGASHHLADTRPSRGAFALITSAEGKRHRPDPNPDRQERRP